jgi:membrane protease YdiL (CAAX protease family)
MKVFLQRHRLSAFFVLAFLLSWYPWLLALLQGRASGPNPLGPLIAAIVLTATVSGRAGLGKFFRRLSHWRVGAKWYAIVFLTPVAICCLAAFLTLCVLPELHLPSLPLAKLREVPERFLFILLFIGLGEEPGWRGFALPEFQGRYSPLRASLLLAPIWALWHLPLMGNEFPWPIVPAFIISVFGATLILTWLFNRTSGSVLAAMLFHATVNTVSAGLIFPLFTGSALTVLWWTYSILWLGLGLALIILDSQNSRLPATRLQAAPA